MPRLDPIRPRPLADASPQPDTTGLRRTIDHQTDTIMTGTKPTGTSKTVKVSFAALLIALWAPLCLLVGAVLGLFGLDVNAAEWTVYADDGAIDAGEWLAIGRDLVLAILAALAIRFRKTASKFLTGGVFRGLLKSEPAGA